MYEKIVKYAWKNIKYAKEILKTLKKKYFLKLLWMPIVYTTNLLSNKQ